MSLLQTINEDYDGRRSDRFNTKLVVTKEHIRQARGNKMQVIAKMRPEDFIKITTSDNHGLDYFQKQCKSVEDYNRWAEEAENIIMPSLWIKGEQISGHEGRHRAASLICAEAKEMPVALRLYPEEEHQEKYGYWEAPYEMKWEDFPSAIHGQYGKGVLLKSDITPVIDGWNHLQESLLEARVAVDAAQVADMYDNWRNKVNWGDVRAEDEKDFWVTDTGFNQYGNIAYANLKVEAKSEDEAKQRAITYLRYKMPVPYTQIDVAGQQASTSFFDEKDVWFVMVSYTQ